MNKKIIIALVVVFSVGLLIGYVLPYFQPKKTIYDKLRDMQISWLRDDFGWGTGIWKLQKATYIEPIEYLEWFKRTYTEKDNSRGTYDSIQVYVDSIYNVVWMEVWKENIPTNIEYIGFYFYSEPD